MIAVIPHSKDSIPRTVVEVLLLATLALALRTHNLLSFPMYFDEVGYLGWGLDIWDKRTFAALMIPILDDGKQPLFSWLSGAASYLFDDPLFAGRMVSALAGVASTIGIYWGGRWLVSRRVGFCAGLLYALVPFNLFYDRMAMVEAILNMACIWAFALSVFISIRASSHRSSRLVGILLGVSLGIAIWTKMTALLMLSFPVFCALLLWRRDRFSLAVGGFAVGAGLFALFAILLFLMPNANNIIDKTKTFSEPLDSLLRFPVERWTTHILKYWSWIYAYLPAPLWWLIPPAIAWGLLRRTRITLLLLGCCSVFAMPGILLARDQFDSRYVSQGIFPILLLLSTLLVACFEALSAKEHPALPRVLHNQTAQIVAAGAVALILIGPTIRFDLTLLNRPDLADLAPSDYAIFVTDWSSGYGFNETVKLVKDRATELTRGGQPIIILGYFWRGHAYTGLKLYTRGMPGVFHYVDMHLARDPEGFIAAWKPHHVPVLVVGNEGLERLDQFERAVPQARRIGYFPKPGGRSAFRVYEVDVSAFD